MRADPPKLVWSWHIVCPSQGRGERVRMMHWADGNRWKWRWWLSVYLHWQTPLCTETALRGKWIMSCNSMSGCRLGHIPDLQNIYSHMKVNQNSIEWSDNPKEQKSYSRCAAWEQPSRGVMTPPRWVWAAAAIDRWPGRLFTVKAPCTALLHYVTFNRALADWNSAPPQCTFRTLAPSLRTSCPCACF